LPLTNIAPLFKAITQTGDCICMMLIPENVEQRTYVKGVRCDAADTCLRTSKNLIRDHKHWTRTGEVTGFFANCKERRSSTEIHFVAMIMANESSPRINIAPSFKQ